MRRKAVVGVVLACFVIVVISVNGVSATIRSASADKEFFIFEPWVDGLEANINFVIYTPFNNMHWDWGDGSASEGLYGTHLYSKSGTYIVTVTLDTKEKGKITKEVKVTVDAAKSAEDLENPNNFHRLTLHSPEISGLKVNINGVVVAPVERIEWDWGDGQKTVSWFAATHTYLHSGTYTVKVTVYDKKGRTTTKEVDVVLSSTNKHSKSKIFENLLLNPDFSQHKVSTDPDNPYRDAFSEWDISAITEVPGGEDGPYPRWIWGPRYPSCSYNGLLIDSPKPSIAYFQQSFFLPPTSTATLQISIRRCIGPCEIKILLTDDSTTHLIDIINTSKGLGEWYGNSKTYSYDISRYSGRDLTLRFEQTSPVWNWSCVLYSEISIAAELLQGFPHN